MTELHTPPLPVQRCAKRALGLAAKHELSLDGASADWARRLARGAGISDELLGFLRVELSKAKAPTVILQPDGAPAPEFVKFLARGGRAGQAWAESGGRRLSPAGPLLRGRLDVTTKAADEMLVFGWAYVSELDGAQVVDHSGEIWESHEIEKTVVDYMLNAQEGRDQHQPGQTGRIVESMFFSAEKQRHLGIDLGKVGWWVGFKVDDPDTWQAIKEGRRLAFSIGGVSERETVDEAEIVLPLRAAA